jgi:hypothetical protein
MVEPVEVQTWQLVTRREAAAILGCSMRTVSRRIADGSLQTARRPNGQRGVVYASVMALAGMDTGAVPVAHHPGTAWPTEAVQLAVGYATLAQAVRAHLGAGWMARKSTRAQLEAVLNQQAAQLAALEQASGPQIALERPIGASEPPEATTVT